MALIVGIDIGRTAVKAVVLRTLVRGWAPVMYRQVPLRTGPRQEAPGTDEVAAALEALVAAGIPMGEMVVSAVPASVASLHFLDLPFSDRKKVEKVIPFEVESCIPFALEGMQVAHQVIEKKGSGGVRAAAAVAPVEALRERMDALQGAGLDPWMVDCDVAALWTVGLARVPAGGPGAEAYAVADLGACHTGLAVVAGQKLVAARSLGTGGDAVTAALARALALPFDEAERIKVDFGGGAGIEAGLAAAPSSDSRRIAEAIGTGLDRIAREIGLALHAAEVREKTEVARLYLAGGGARLGGLAPHLAGLLGIEVRDLDLGDLQGARGPAGPEAACALGLALKGVRGIGGSTLNFRRGELAQRRQAREIASRIVPAVWPIALCVILAMASLGIRCSATSSRLDVLRKERSDLFAQTFRSPEGPDPVRQAKSLIDGRRQKLALLGGVFGPLEGLREIATRLPADARVLVNELEADPDRIVFTALTDSFEKAGRVRDELSKCPEFARVEVANQTKDRDRVRFTVSIHLTRGKE